MEKESGTVIENITIPEANQKFPELHVNVADQDDTQNSGIFNNSANYPDEHEDSKDEMKFRRFRAKRKPIMSEITKYFACAVCNAEFPKEELFLDHVNEFHTDEFPFPCDQCKKRFASPIQLKTHQTIHDPTRYKGVPQFQCEFCEKSYHLKVSLLAHRNFKHFGYRPPPKKNSNGMRITLPRNSGGRGRLRKSYNRLNTNRITEKRKIRIPKPASGLDQDDSSSQFPENPQIIPSKKIRSCLCTICDTILPNQVEFQKHLSTAHADFRRYPCPHCGKTFASPAQVSTHKEIHDPTRFHGDPQYACDLCDKKYHLKRSLQTHRRYIHTGKIRPRYKRKAVPLVLHHSIGTRRPEPEVKPERPSHPCPKCDLTFPYRNEVRKHMRTHSNARPVKCDICSQSFVCKNGLRVHKRNLHENPGNVRHLAPRFMYQSKQGWDCEVCGRKFRLPNQLQTHLRMHTGEMPFECEKCSRKFRTTGGLRAHMKIHVEEFPLLKRFKCLICGKENFKRFSELNNHRRNRHPNIPYQNEKEKGFACGICGKPYFLRENAAICALLRHDSTKLRKFMFRMKCSECPPERLGHRSLHVLRQHWMEEHKDKKIPAKYRAGMYNENSKNKEALPVAPLDKKKAQEIKDHGLPKDQDYDFPLYLELPLLNVQEITEGQEGQVFTRQCKICNKILRNSNSLRNHVKYGKCSSGSLRKRTKYDSKDLECIPCGFQFKTMFNLRKHKKCKSHMDRVRNPLSKIRNKQKVKYNGAEVDNKADVYTLKIMENETFIKQEVEMESEENIEEDTGGERADKAKKIVLSVIFNKKKKSPPPKNWRIPSKCPKCLKVFTCKYTLKRHLVEARHPEETDVEIEDAVDNVEVPIIKSVTSVATTVLCGTSSVENEQDDNVVSMATPGYFEKTRGDLVMTDGVVIKKEIEDPVNQVDGQEEMVDFMVDVDGACEVGEVQIKMENWIQHHQDAEISKSLGNEINVVKRKRGRPRKTDKLVNSNYSKVKSKKCKRGRPAKRKSESEDEGQDNDDDDSVVVEEKTEHKCFICGFEASSASVLKRHVMGCIELGDENRQNFKEQQPVDYQTKSGHPPKVKVKKVVNSLGKVNVKTKSMEKVKKRKYQKKIKNGNNNCLSGNYHGINVNDKDKIKSILTKGELRIVLKQRVDDEDFDWEELISLYKIG